MERSQLVYLVVLGVLLSPGCSGPGGDDDDSSVGDDDTADDDDTTLDPTRQIDIARGTAPTIDGTLADGEWSDAHTTSIEVADGWTVTVWAKHGDEDLYFAFDGLMEGGTRFPEVVLDLDHDAGAWGDDDWWFHVSGTDCEGHGLPNDYSTCEDQGDGWEGNNAPFVDGAVEMRIGYAKVGLVPGETGTIGIAFDVTDTATNWSFWPETATLEDPSTWGEAISSTDWN